MATNAESFVQQTRAQLDKASTALATIQKILAQDSQLQKSVTALVNQRDQLAQKLDAIAPDQPLDDKAAKNLRSDVAALLRRASRIREGVDFAEDPKPPTLGAWIWFGAEVVVILLVAWLYLYVHSGRPLLTVLRGITPQVRVDLALQLGDLKHLALAAQPDREALTATLSEIDATIAAANFTPDEKTTIDAPLNDIRAELEPSSTIDGQVIAVYVDQIVAVLRAQESFFFDSGVGRYVEVLFGVFFGVMAFALYNNWEYMRHPGRAWWIAWHIAKGFMALVLGFVTIVILSQVNFATPASLDDQRAFGLGFAPIELVIAISALVGYFSHRAVAFLDRYAERILGPAA